MLMEASLFLAAEFSRMIRTDHVRSRFDLFKLSGHKSVTDVSVDDCRDAEASAEGAFLSTWAYDELKSKKHRLGALNLRPLDENAAGRDWFIGSRKAIGQNLARTLMEAPSNVITPIEFAKVIQFPVRQAFNNRFALCSTAVEHTP